MIFFEKLFIRRYTSEKIDSKEEKNKKNLQNYNVSK
jgi:hypothetical protein